jgi:hypothetical protein
VANAGEYLGRIEMYEVIFFFRSEGWLMTQICIDGHHPGRNFSDVEISISLTYSIDHR